MKGEKMLMLASVASMIDQFNMPNIRLLLEIGYEVHVACNFKEGNTCDDERIGSLRKTLRDLGVIMHQWDCPRDVYSFRNCCRAYRQVRKLLERYPVEWLHCHSPIGGALARIAAYEAGVPVIYTAHGFHFYRGAPWKNWLLYYPAEKLLARQTDVLITVNQEDDRFARRHLRAGKICRIPGVGIDTAHFRKPCKEKFQENMFYVRYRIPPDACVLLSVGELNQGKNHRMVIDALAAMQREDIYYLICGQGALREELLRYADRRGVGRQLRMPGYQSDMAWIYGNADIFVFPSRREGMPVALMEAMAAGLPCVVSDIRGNRELIRDMRGGFRFSLHKPEQLIPALERLVDDEGLRQRCGRFNQEKIKAYDQAAVSSRMKKIYAEFGGCPAGGSKGKRSSGADAAPLISVIMPVYELAGDPVLLAAVRSVWKQTYQNWELILCDDGSADGTMQTLRQIASMDQRVHVIQNPKNRGAGYARNVCIRAASGKYIALMDADDISHPRRLEKQAAFLERHPEYAMAGCDVWLRDRHGIWGRRKLEEKPDKRSFLSTLPFVHPSIMLRAETVKELHGYARTRLTRRVEDYEFLMRLYAKGYRGYNLQEELFSYLEEPDSYQKRKYRDRIAECAVRWQGFRRLGILKGHVRYVLKPLIVGLIPGWLLRIQRRKRFVVKRRPALAAADTEKKKIRSEKTVCTHV